MVIDYCSTKILVWFFYYFQENVTYSAFENNYVVLSKTEHLPNTEKDKQYEQKVTWKWLCWTTVYSQLKERQIAIGGLKPPWKRYIIDTMRDFYMISMFCLLKHSFVTIIFSYEGKNLILLQITLKGESAGPRPANKVLLEHSQT